MSTRLFAILIFYCVSFGSFYHPDTLTAEDIHHDHHEDEHAGEVHLSEDELHELDIQVNTAQPGVLFVQITLPGEVRLNRDRHAHIVPRVSGIVTEVRKKLGDTVRKGETIAVAASNSLADAKANYLAFLERVELAEMNFEREESLMGKNISSKKEFFEAKQTLAEAKIGLRSSKQKLLALGFSENFLNELPAHDEISYTRYELSAPFDGTVINKHITLGELITSETTVFEIADLDTVWIDLQVYPKDLPLIRKGQKVSIFGGYGMPEMEAEIVYVGVVVDAQTRTALARISIPNDNGQWRPGMFVTAHVTIEQADVSVLIPKTALHTFDGQTCVFIQTEDGFKPEPVTIGRSNKTSVEIVSGLKRGDVYVVHGGFMLKSELEKAAFAGDGHGH